MTSPESQTEVIARLRSGLARLFVLVAAIALAGSSRAELAVSHLGDSDPTTEGWVATGAGVSVTVGPEAGDEGSVDAWGIDDDGTGVGSQLSYRFAPSPAQVAGGAARGWRLTARLRVAEFPDLPDGGEAIVLAYRDGARHWALRFHADVAGLPIVVLGDDVVPEPRVNLATAGYHAYQIVFEPVSGLASLYVDGELARAGWDGVPDAGAAEIVWGSRDDGDTGRGHTAAVAFETLEAGPACSDGLDNDGDGLSDFPLDPGCADPDAEHEDPACDDGVDDDGDGLADWDGAGLGAPDPDCAGDGSRISERPLRQLGCLLPEARITLAGPPPGSAEVTGTCFFEASLSQTVPTQATPSASLQGIPGSGLQQGRQQHDVVGGVLSPVDNLRTEYSPVLTFSVPRGVDPDERVVVVSELFRSGTFHEFVAEAHVSGNGVDVTCGIPEGSAECDVTLPGGAVYFLEPTLASYVYVGEGRSSLGIGVSHVTRCADGLDNDGDLLIDLADPQCTTAASLDEVENFCADGLDNDGDGLVDGGDPGCTGPGDVSELNPALECDDGADNDGDLLVDAADPGCASPLQNDESPQCQDGVDNDGDLAIDHPADAGCGSPSQDSENPECQDGIDNDANGASDFPADPGCTGPLDLVENAPPFECGDSLDNDGDGATDFPGDPGCVSLLDPSERVTSSLQRRCVKTINARGAKRAGVQNRDARRCLGAAQRDRTDLLGSPVQTRTPQACLTNDVRGAVARQLAKLVAGEADHCTASPDQLPLFGYTSSAAVDVAASDAVVRLVADLFGADLGPAVILRSFDRDAARCQREILSRSTRLFDQLWRSARAQVASSLARSDGSEPANALELTTEVLAALALDSDGRIARRVDQLDAGALLRCSGLAPALSDVLPGSCATAATPGPLAECAEQRTRCRFCLSLDAFDGLAADCDAFDDGLANGSCF